MALCVDQDRTVLSASEVSLRMYPVMVEENETLVDYEDKQTQSKSEEYSK